ncbi:MAG: excinuclease ABC subunit C, partial [Alphaproteobacteria bacterium]|nr:excinuclease ABC subunit C [Alphaproteobacteria bacterium]
QGSFAVGAMVVATPSGFDKKSYRTFNIKYTENTHDDFAMMREVLLRRFERMSDENRPDVILLDGGLGQLHAVHEALQNYDLSGITIIAISKGPERNAGKEFYHVIGRESFALPFQSSIAFYMQNLRDEAHRFAIGTHRKKRAKSIYKSQIDEIEGIGAKRKHDLLNFFGSVEQIKGASINDLTKVAGISKKVAEKIYNYFHN